MQKWKFTVLLLMIFGMAALAGCEKNENTTVVFTTGFSRDEVFRIEDCSCRLPEIMVYLTNMQNQYENVYGEEIWSVRSDGVDMEENVKETGLAKIAQIKTMNLLAEEKGVGLDEEEKALASAAAEEYFNSLNDTEKEFLKVEQKDIQQMYEEYALAEKVYRHIIKDINPEISDDEARIVTVQRIYLRTYTLDGSGQQIPYSTKMKAETFEKAQEILNAVHEEDADFGALASQNSDAVETTVSFGKGETDPAVEDTAFRMETGEISPILEGEDGYYILKCVNTYDAEQTDANKLKIMEERKHEVFGQVYDAFVDTLTKNLNKKLWDDVTLIRDERVTTASFFSVYARYFTP